MDGRHSTGCITDTLAARHVLRNLLTLLPPSRARVVCCHASRVILVHHLTQAALARGQRMRLRHPTCPCFVSYARADEGFARGLVAHLEAKGADVWWDLNSMTLSAPLDESLRSAVGDARFLLLLASPAADKSPYVHLEVEAAIRRGLRVVPFSLDGRIPAGLQSLLDSAPDSIEPIISAIDS